MALQEKYKQLIDAATAAGVSNLQVREKDNVLYIDGDAPTGTIKDELWNLYDKIDPNFAGGDLVLNVNVSGAAAGGKLKVTTEKSSLNIRKGPGTDQPIIGKAPHNGTVTLVSKSSELWWLIRNGEGVEGYAYASYLEPVQ